MRLQTDPPLVPYTRSKDLDNTSANGGRTREREYYEHYRAQGVYLSPKYRP